jgi:hypothetical protein
MDHSAWRYWHLMRQLKPRGVLERSAGADLFKHTLSSIPTVYGRMAYLASLRDPNSGVYRHHGLGVAFGRDQSIRALQSSHTKVFREWLNLPLRRKSSDLVEYLEGLGDPRGVVVRHWLRSRGYLTCIPDAASKAERELYTGDVEALLNALNHVAGGAALGPKS